jgi:hypothetical protein
VGVLSLAFEFDRAEAEAMVLVFPFMVKSSEIDEGCVNEMCSLRLLARARRILFTVVSWYAFM